ncbi:nSTAND1 domain-containing NTPase, partial [Mangrovihabitans endophyticus]
MRKFFIGAATTTYRPQLGLGDRPELADELWRAREAFTGLGYTVADGFGPGMGAKAFQDRLRAFLFDADRQPQDVVVVFYTGHGVSHDGELLLPMADTSDLSYDSVRAGDLTGRILDSYEPGRVAGQQLLFILDTCYAGSASASMGRGAAEFLARLRGSAKAPSVAVIVAARDYESAEAGRFTQALTEVAQQDRSVAGYEVPFLPLEPLVTAINTRLPPAQNARLVYIGESASQFFPNPRFDDWFSDYDLRTRDLRAQQTAREQERRDHVMPRAKGLDAAGGRDDLWLFTGRHAALREAVRWLACAGPGTMVVTGRPGSGKSALLARLDVLADSKRRRWIPDLHLLPADTIPADHAISRFVHARGQTPQDLLAALAEAAGIDDISGIDSVKDLVRRLPRDGGPRVVIVDAVDEAVDSSQDQHRASPVVEQVLAPLVAASGRIPLRLLIGTRSHLLDAIGQPAALVDLDQPGFADRASVHQYARRCLTELVETSPYRHQPPAFVDAVADAVTDSAGDSFLVALIAARSLALLPQPVTNPYDAAWRARLPRHAADAMRQDLDQRLGGQADRARDLLLPLAYAEAAGLPWEDLWPRLVQTLTGRSCGNADLEWLIEQAGYYIIETSLQRRSVYRLYHESLAEHLRAGRDTEADQAAIVDVLTDRVPRLADGTTDWAQAHPYTAATIATHAAGTDRLDHLVSQPRFLLDTPPAPLAVALPQTRTPDGHATADAYRRALNRIRAAPHQHRAAYLQLAARCARAPHLAQAITDSGLPLPFVTDWASCRLPTAHHTITGHTGEVDAVAVGQLDGRTIIVSGSDDNTVRVWDAATGTPVGDPFTGHTGWVNAVAVGQLDGRTIIVSGSNDHTVRVWDAATGAPIGDPFTGHTSLVLSVAVGQLDGRTIIVSGSGDRTVRVWDAATGAPVGDPFTGHTSLVLSVAVGQLDGRTIIVSGSSDRTVRVWDAATGTPIGDPFTGHTDWVRSVAVGQLDGRTIIVSGSGDRTVRVWDAATGAPVGDPFTGHTSLVLSVAVGQLDGRTIIVSGSSDNTVRVWDAATGAPIGDPFTGHTSPVLSVAVGQLDGRTIIVSGSSDNTVRV